MVCSFSVQLRYDIVGEFQMCAHLEREGHTILSVEDQFANNIANWWSSSHRQAILAQFMRPPPDNVTVPAHFPGSLKELHHKMHLFSCETAIAPHFDRSGFHLVEAIVPKWGMDTVLAAFLAPKWGMNPIYLLTMSEP